MEVLQRTANRGSISDGGYNIDNSIMFTTEGTYADANSLFYDIMKQSEGFAADANAGTNARKCTVSAWVKRTKITNSSHYDRIFSYRGGGVAFDVYFDPATDQLTMYDDNTSMSLKTNRAFRDTSAWYHIVVAVDQTQGTAANRVNVYVNGVQETSFATEDYGNQNVDLSAFRAESISVYVGGAGHEASAYFNGYIAEYNFIDGAQLAQTEFGEFDDDSGIWKPKKFTGSYGTLGHYYNFTVANDMGKDFSGNGNDSNNRGDGIANGAARQATDTPTNNFCTFNPLMDQGNSPTISDGATKSTGGGSNWNQTWGSIGVKNGKWYYEMKVTNTSSTGYIGASTTPAVSDYTNTVQLMYNTSFMLGQASRIDYYYWQSGSQVSNESTGWGTISTNDIIGIALDLDSSTKKFIVYKNGSALNGSGTDLPTNMQNEFIFPLYVQYENRADEINLGGYTTMTISSAASDGNGYGTFEIAPPSGYYALCTKNLAEFG